jgi:hypothetical protein
MKLNLLNKNLASIITKLKKIIWFNIEYFFNVLNKFLSSLTFQDELEQLIIAYKS